MLSKRPVRFLHPQGIVVASAFWATHLDLSIQDRFILLSLIAMADDRGLIVNDSTRIARSLGLGVELVETSIKRLEMSRDIVRVKNPSSIMVMHYSDASSVYGITPYLSPIENELLRQFDTEREDMRAIASIDSVTVRRSTRPKTKHHSRPRHEQHKLTARDVAHEYRITLQTVWRYCRQGLIPHARIGRAVRFDRGELDRWFAAKADSGGPLDAAG
jgi:excisionase family DNA binding protein